MEEIITKKCSTCKERKNTDQFYRHKLKKDGLACVCKECSKKTDKIRFQSRSSALQKREYKLKRKYGLTQIDYLNMYEKQNGKCAICGEFQEILSVDHSHKELKIRGLLCRECNIGIGFLKDSCSILENAVKYLKSQ